jgi:hypothetical protein
MFNPWLTLSIQTVRLGWETQAAVVAQLMQFSGAGASRGRSAAPIDTAAPVDVEDGVALTAGLSPSIEKPTRGGKHREIAENAKIHKKRSRGSKRRHLK